MLINNKSLTIIKSTFPLTIKLHDALCLPEEFHQLSQVVHQLHSPPPPDLVPRHLY